MSKIKAIYCKHNISKRTLCPVIKQPLPPLSLLDTTLECRIRKFRKLTDIAWLILYVENNTNSYDICHAVARQSKCHQICRKRNYDLSSFDYGCRIHVWVIFYRHWNIYETYICVWKSGKEYTSRINSNSSVKRINETYNKLKDTSNENHFVRVLSK